MASFDEMLPEFRQNYTSAVEEMVKVDSDAFIHCLAHPRARNFVLQLMKERDYTPKLAAGVGSFLDTIDADVLPFQVIFTKVNLSSLFLLSHFFFSQYSPIANFGVLLWNLTIEEVKQSFLLRFGTPLEDFASDAIVAGQVIEKIVNDSNSLEVRKHLMHQNLMNLFLDR